MKWLSGGLAATAGFVLIQEMPECAPVHETRNLDNLWYFDKGDKTINYVGREQDGCTTVEFYKWIREQYDGELRVIPQ